MRKAIALALLVGTDLTNANLTGAKLTDSDLSGTVFNGASLQGADLSGANLSGARGNNLIACPYALPSGWVCKNNSLIQGK